MARNYANVSTAIWRDDDFRARTASAQWMYLLLVSQADISAAGVLPLAVRRWSQRAADVKPSEVRARLDELQGARFVVYDEDTEELLVRSFVRWDGGYGNPKRRPVIIRAALDVESMAIRRAIAAEFARLGLPTDGLPDSQADSLSGSRSRAIPEASAQASGRPENRVTAVIGHSSDPDLSSQANSLSDRHADTESPSDGVVVTQATYLGTTTHNPQTTTPPAAGVAPSPPAPSPALSETQRSKRITDAYAAAEPMCKWPAVNGVVLKAIRTGRWPDDEIQAALLRLAAESRSVTVDTLRIELTGMPPSTAIARYGRNGNQPYIATSDRKVAQVDVALASLKAKMQQNGDPR